MTSRIELINYGKRERFVSLWYPQDAGGVSMLRSKARFWGEGAVRDAEATLALWTAEHGAVQEPHSFAELSDGDGCAQCGSPWERDWHIVKLADHKFLGPLEGEYCSRCGLPRYSHPDTGQPASVPMTPDDPPPADAAPAQTNTGRHLDQMAREVSSLGARVTSLELSRQRIEAAERERLTGQEIRNLTMDPPREPVWPPETPR